MAKGIAYRDPTRDKRIIEFCLSLPVSQFFKDGKDRNLIRQSMKGTVPDKIRLNYYKRGFQSVDWLKRLEPDYYNICFKIEQCKCDQPIYKYIDFKKLLVYLNKAMDTNDKRQNESMKRCLEVLITNQFIKNI